MSDLNKSLINKDAAVSLWDSWCIKVRNSGWHTNVMILVIKILVALTLIVLLSVAVNNLRKNREPFAFITDLIC